MSVHDGPAGMGTETVHTDDAPSAAARDGQATTAGDLLPGTAVERGAVALRA